MGVIRAFQKQGQIVSTSFIREVRVSGSSTQNLRKGSIQANNRKINEKSEKSTKKQEIGRL